MLRAAQSYLESTNSTSQIQTGHGRRPEGGRHSNPVVTTPTIALDFSGTTQQLASHNVAPNQTQQSSRKLSSRKLYQKLVDSSQLEPDANIATQRFNLSERRRIDPSTGSSNPQLSQLTQMQRLPDATQTQRLKFKIHPDASYNNHKIPNPTSRWLQHG
ncbi:hypothetical protein F511_32443 [Dorcoceras hygrometricum]|uniref:Uncharacterized protein n=1 Tax=Dorcoceras hygrometricum TaxID=472368 RepID=A0A2Z7D157_9LAMI|nr:hypothetical protein F511_32443 [Dorcoceras hygrometricum]